MPVGLDAPTKVHVIGGVRLATAAAGVRYQGREDLALIEIAAHSSVAAMFTQNKFCAAPVHIAKDHLNTSRPRYLVINSGNANAGTGDDGIKVALQVAQCVASEAKLTVEQVLPFSTGVIGEALDADKICKCVPNLMQSLSADHWIPAAQAIMTTDTVAKAFSEKIELANGAIHITGIAKGSGMIRPNMATMLAYIASDIEVDTDTIQVLLNNSVEHSFNAITVDGDTSTNDACVLIATGKSKLKYALLSADDKRQFEQGLTGLMQDLAQAIVRDGEGASKFVCVHVCDALTTDQASTVAFSVANSPLVKTALAASDPNWGRIMAAVGYAQDENLQLATAKLHINGLSVWQNGRLAPEYNEAAGKTAMAPEEITIKISLGLGSAEKSVWTTDLTHEYIRINAEYRT